MLSLRDFDGDGLFTLLAKVPPAPVMCKVMNCRIFYKLTVTAVPCLAYKHYSSISSRSLLSLCVQYAIFQVALQHRVCKLLRKVSFYNNVTVLEKEENVENAKIALKKKNAKKFGKSKNC